MTSTGPGASIVSGEKEITIKEVYRPIKRVRQACAVCRGRKVRCTGERPDCAVCIRSGHNCNYTDGNNQAGDTAAPAVADSRSHGTSLGDGNFTSDSNEQLAIRVALLERQLHELTKHLKSASSDDDEHQSLPEETEKENYHYDSDAKVELPHKGASLFIALPPRKIIYSLIDLFFIKTYNQPYLFFHERTFRRRLDNRAVPDYLLFAILATVLRSAKDPYFQEKENEAAESYATSSWRLISPFFHGDQGELGLDSIFALTFLSLHDLTAGRRQIAWVKLGAVIRVAQDLGLMKEPDKTLPIISQEERRRAFWTVYLLDKFTLCGCDRAPAISDSDCKVSLPCNELAFQKGNEENREPCLERMFENEPNPHKPNHFALSMVMASTLGKIGRYMLSQEPVEPMPLWDKRSNYSILTSSRLARFERFFSHGIPIRKIVERNFTCKGGVDHQQAGHLMLNKVLFHLSYCLSTHPLLLRHRLACYPSSHVPPSFLGRAIQKCTEHATAISTFMQEAKESGCNTSIPYFCYSVGVCCSVHALNLYHTDDNKRTEALMHFQRGCDYLRQFPRHRYTRYILSTLETLQQESRYFQCLLAPSTCLSSSIEPGKLDILWRVLDFAAVADSPSEAPKYRDSSMPRQFDTSPHNPDIPGDVAAPITSSLDTQAIAQQMDPSDFDYLDAFPSSDWNYLGPDGNDLSLIFEEPGFAR